MAMRKKPGATSSANGTSPFQKLARLLPAPVEPVGQVEDDRELRELGRLERAEARG